MMASVLLQSVRHYAGTPLRPSSVRSAAPVRGYVLLMREDMESPWSVESPLFVKGELKQAQEACCNMSTTTPYMWDIGVVTSIMSYMCGDDTGEIT